jgi:hypothetical protein
MFEPPLAGQIEQVFPLGQPVLAYPRGRHAELEAWRPAASVVVVVDGPRPALETLEAPFDPGVEVVVFDNGSPAFAECAAFARGGLNRVLYRSPRRLPRAEAWRLARALAHGAELVEGVPETRERAILALGAELVANPRLLELYRERFGAADDTTLVILASDADVALLPAAVEAAGLGDADLVAIVARPGDGTDRRLAAVCHAVLR